MEVVTDLRVAVEFIKWHAGDRQFHVIVSIKDES